MEVIGARHIQVADDSSRKETHWGYVDRILPCTNDAGSCEYLDAVYVSHYSILFLSRPRSSCPTISRFASLSPLKDVHSAPNTDRL